MNYCAKSFVIQTLSGLTKIRMLKEWKRLLKHQSRLTPVIGISDCMAIGKSLACSIESSLIERIPLN